MPIYCFKCLKCEKVIEVFRQDHNPPERIRHQCDLPGNPTSGARRHLASERPAIHTDDDYNFQPYYDQGAGQHFHTKAQYKSWQRANTDHEGCAPEPMEGKRRKAALEEAAHACHINKQPTFDEAGFDAALRKAYDDAHDELSKRSAMGLQTHDVPVAESDDLHEVTYTKPNKKRAQGAIERAG